MSDLSRQEWMERALNCAKRLVRFIELGAPAVMYQKELEMIAARLEKADPGEWAAATESRAQEKD